MTEYEYLKREVACISSGKLNKKFDSVIYDECEGDLGLMRIARAIILIESFKRNKIFRFLERLLFLTCKIIGINVNMTLGIMQTSYDTFFDNVYWPSDIEVIRRGLRVVKEKYQGSLFLLGFAYNGSKKYSYVLRGVWDSII